MSNKYKNSHYGNCDYCANDGGSYCSECEHYEHSLHDHWVENTPEEIERIKIAELEEAIDKAIDEGIELDIPTDLKNTFDLAKKCTARVSVSPSLMGVYMAEDGYMVASDGYILSKIKCESIPECLKGRIVITLQGGVAGISHDRYASYDHILTAENNCNIPLSGVIRTTIKKDGFNIIHLHLNGTIVALADERLQLAEEILQGNITVHYNFGEIHSPITFKGSSGTVVIVPLRGASE